MKQLLLTSLAITCCAIASVSADENIRAVQARLKEGGFYFGEANGRSDSETAAAITRYQIRNGLPISGKVDRETAKALGVEPAESAAPAGPAESETWQRLRKTDQQFLSKLDRGKDAVPARPSAKAEVGPRPGQPQRPPVATAPASAPLEEQGSGRFILSRERLRDYIGAFVLAGLHPGVGSELEFFADRVSYYGEGVVDRRKIRRDLQIYNDRWPQRRFWLAGEVQIAPQADSRIRVTFPLRFQLANGAKRSSGKVQKTLLLEVLGDDLQIVAVNERKGR